MAQPQRGKRQLRRYLHDVTVQVPRTTLWRHRKRKRELENHGDRSETKHILDRRSSHLSSFAASPLSGWDTADRSPIHIRSPPYTVHQPPSDEDSFPPSSDTVEPSTDIGSPPSTPHQPPSDPESSISVLDSLEPSNPSSDSDVSLLSQQDHLELFEPLYPGDILRSREERLQESREERRKSEERLQESREERRKSEARLQESREERRKSEERLQESREERRKSEESLKESREERRKSEARLQESREERRKSEERLQKSSKERRKREAQLLSAIMPLTESTLKDELWQLRRHIENLERKVDELTSLLERVIEQPKSDHMYSLLMKEGPDATFKAGSDAQLLRLPAHTPYSWALQAFSILFTKKELSSSLLYKSKKSNKPALDHKRVERLLSLMEQRFQKDTWDIRTLQQKINQKCRDTKIVAPAETASPAETMH